MLTLASRMAHSDTSDTSIGSMVNRHSRRRSNPANSPAAANNNATWGPVSPSAIGSGGASNAHARKNASQAFGIATIGQTMGSNRMGALRTILLARDGAIAANAA